VGLECKQTRNGYALTIPGKVALNVFADFDAKDAFAWPEEQQTAYKSG
jgi:hypothetical protein